MITHISEKESQVTHMLTVCNEALREVTKERDAQRKALEQALEAMQSATRSYGILLLSDPPQDAWKVNRVSDRLYTAITAIQGVLK